MAGTVLALGEEVNNVEVGDRVLATVKVGGLAERVRTRANRLIAIPDGIAPVEAAAFLYAYGTAQHALKDRAGLASGETLLVLGAAGSVGLAAVELGARYGATVVAAASTEEKLALCRDYGAGHTINYETDDMRHRIRDITSGAGVDVVLDVVGGAYSEAALRSTAWGGRYLVVGFASGVIPSIALNLPLLKGSSVVGVYWGASIARHPQRHARNVAELTKWWGEGKLRPHIGATYPLSAAPKAMRAVGSRATTGRIVVRMSD